MRPYLDHSIDQLEAEFDRAKRFSDPQTLKQIAHELTFRKTGRAADLRDEVTAILGAGPQASAKSLLEPRNPASPQATKPNLQRPATTQQPATSSRRPTPEQEEAVELFARGGSLKINAYAGTGKTSTLELLAHRSRLHGQYLAFNASIVRDAKQRFPSRVNCSTTHSLALKLIRPQFDGDSGKLFNRLNANQLAQLLNLKKWRIGPNHTLEPRSQGALVLSTIQRFAQSADREFQKRHVVRKGSLLTADCAVLDEVASFAVRAAEHVWARMMDPNDPVPLGHDGYLKLWAMSEPTIAANYILLDEAQDTNPVVLDVLQRQEAQMVYVGDKYQQIYEWRGAVNAMETIETDHSSYLTTSFRFGDQLAGAASHLLTRLGESRPLRGNPAKQTKIVTEGASDTILARTNASTISAVIEALDAGQQPHLVGGTEELLTLLRGVQDLKAGQPSTVPDFFGFTSWRDLVEFARSGEGDHLLTFVNLVEERGERQLMWTISRTVEEQRADVVIATAHKSKGREWNRVRLMDDFMKSRPAAKADCEAENNVLPDAAELRLFYVAVTRAKECLSLPPSLFSMVGLPEPKAPSVVQEVHAPPRQNPIAANAPTRPETRATPAWTPPRDWNAAVATRTAERSKAGPSDEATRPPQRDIQPRSTPSASSKPGGFWKWLLGR